MNNSLENEKQKFPKIFLLVVTFMCAAPIFLNGLGFDFSSISHGISVQDMAAKNLPRGLELDQMFYTLTGGLHHGLLEWSAVMAAMLTIILAFAHFAINKDVTMPIIGVALFCSGAMDAFHTMAAMRLIDAVASNTDLIPFTWALSRGFNAGIMIVGALICLKLRITNTRIGLFRIGIVSIMFGTLAYTLINYAAGHENLPQTQFPDSWITRPYDALPLVLFIIAIPIFWNLYRKNPNLLTASLVITIIPEIVLEAHMAFGSSSLFDNHFNIAHSLKILAYMIPFIGLVLDYVRTYQIQIEIKQQLVERKDKLEQLIGKLTDSNEELERFAYVASHDLQEPLRMVTNFTSLLEKRYGDQLDDTAKEYMAFSSNGARRMQELIEDLLEYARIGEENERYQNIDIGKTIALIQENLKESIDTSGAKITHGDLPIIYGNQVRFMRALQNLIGNGIKYQKLNSQPEIHINVEKKDDTWLFSIKDNGIGMQQKYCKKIFEPFKRLHGKEEFSGTGMGLAICRKIIDRMGGSIWVESELGQGSIFYFILPIHNKKERST